MFLDIYLCLKKEKKYFIIYHKKNIFDLFQVMCLQRLNFSFLIGGLNKIIIDSMNSISNTLVY